MFEKYINYFLGLGICNCSICRKRNGKTATGILTNLANHRGYNSVHHYLESLHCKNEQDENSQNTSKPEVNQNELKSEMKADYKDEGKADKTEVNQNKVESETEMKVEKTIVHQNGLKSEADVMVQIKGEPIYIVYTVHDNSDKNSKMIMKFKKVEENLKEEKHFDEVH